jgi:fucose 4-O-acetylase-like acetyltransferase
MTADPAARHHDLDALRAFAMLLGIALHAALSFMDGIWMVRDDQMSGALTLLVHAVHGFRMPLFFLLSGLFRHLESELKLSLIIYFNSLNYFLKII